MIHPCTEYQSTCLDVHAIGWVMAEIQKQIDHGVECAIGWFYPCTYLGMYLQLCNCEINLDRHAGEAAVKTMSIIKNSTTKNLVKPIVQYQTEDIYLCPPVLYQPYYLNLPHVVLAIPFLFRHLWLRIDCRMFPVGVIRWADSTCELTPTSGAKLD